MSKINTKHIEDKAITLAKMDDMATSSLIYRKTAGTGVPEVNTLATLKTDLGLSNTNTGDQDLSTYVVGPASSTDDNIVTFDGTTGKVIQDSGAKLSDYLTSETDPVFSAWDKDYDDLTNKPTIPTVPSKAAGSDINTGTDDTKYVTSKAIADSTVVKGPASSVDSYLPVFDGITGKLLKESNIYQVINPTYSIFGLITKGLDGNLGPTIYRSANRNKVSNLSTPTEDTEAANKKYVDDSIGAIDIPTQYTDEMAQDAVGTILTDSTEIDFTYTDATPSITASIKSGSIDESKLDTSVNASLDLADSAAQSLGDIADGFQDVVNGKVRGLRVWGYDENEGPAILRYTDDDGSTYVNKITDLDTPTADGEAANKKYVDDSIPTIVDNLTSTSATDALSANMGKSLEDTKLDRAGTVVATLNDDTAMSVTPPAQLGMVFIQPRASGYAEIVGQAVYRCTSTNVFRKTMFAGAKFVMTTGALTGTTGTDGNFTVSCHSDGKIYFENRVGIPVSFTYIFMGS